MGLKNSLKAVVSNTVKQHTYFHAVRIWGAAPLAQLHTDCYFTFLFPLPTHPFVQYVGGCGQGGQSVSTEHIARSPRLSVIGNQPCAAG